MIAMILIDGSITVVNSITEQIETATVIREAK